MSTIMDRLREETREQHKHAESRPLEIALVRGAVSRKTYIRYLAQRLCVHRGLEAAVDQLVTSDPRLADLDLRPLFQVPNIEADLRFFEAGSDPEPLPETTTFLNLMKTEADAAPLAWLGCYYVFEGSKNGASFIARSIRKALELDRDGTHYLDPHGDQQRPLWQAFKDRMNAIDLTPAEQDAIVAAARLTFDGVAAIDDAVADAIATAPAE